MEERREDVKKTVLGDKKLRDIIWEKLSVIDKGEEQVLVLPWHLGREARDKTEPPIDTYDTAVMMAVTCLSEQSVAMGSMPVPFPDFTCGLWVHRK